MSRSHSKSTNSRGPHSQKSLAPADMLDEQFAAALERREERRMGDPKPLSPVTLPHVAWLHRPDPEKKAR